MYTLLFATTLAAEEKFQIEHGPYLQQVTEEGATIVWTTNRKAVSWLELAPDDNTHFYAEARPKFFETNSGRKAIGTLHKIRINGLKPGTSYRYRIFSSEVLGGNKRESSASPFYGATASTNVFRKAPLSFKTPDASKAGIHFAVVNDIHEDNQLLSSLLKQVDTKNLDFIAFNGDMVSNMDSEKQIFDGFINTAVTTFASELPFFYARGNHETRGFFAGEYTRYFPTPTGQPYYTFRQGPVFFIVLDAGEDKPDDDIEYKNLAAYDDYRATQAKWLEETLQSDAFKQAPVKIVFIHVPPSDGWYGERQVRRLFLPLLNDAGIDLALSGHWHTHRYYPKGEEQYNFPLLVNANKHIVDIQVNQNTISVRILTEDGKLFKEIHP
jgi:predicted phosphodiesterase